VRSGSGCGIVRGGIAKPPPPRATGGEREREEGKLSYEEILKKKPSLAYPLEQHLSEWEFEEIFGMKMAAFEKLPAWKKKLIRQENDLF